jgi:hypothetical protein
VNQIAQTWLTVGATLSAALLGAIVAYVGASRQQRKQAERDAEIRHEEAARQTRLRLEHASSELLAATQDLAIGVRTFRAAHSRRAGWRYYLRLAAMLMRDYPPPESWSDLRELSRLRPLLATALEADRYQLDDNRAFALDLAAVMATKGSRYLAVAALITLGEDKEMAEAVRQLSKNVMGLMDAIPARNHEFEQRSRELQMALEEFRAVADKRLGNTDNRPP